MGTTKASGYYHGCQSFGLGSPYRKLYPAERLLHVISSHFVKPKRIDFRLRSIEGMEPSYSGKKCTYPIRQQHCSSIPEQTRGYKEPSPLPSCSQNLSLGRKEYLCTICSPYKRKRKRDDRFSESEASAEGGVDAEPQNIFCNSAEVRQTSDRSICLGGKITS